MPVEILKEKFTGTVQEVVLGATKEEGGQEPILLN